MSEEEIIQHFEFIKSGIKEETKFIDISILECFEDLLDLYNKEKEKNKILELAKIPYLEGEIMAYKENDAVQRKMLNDAFDRGWIHKDKIRKKIKEYEETRQKTNDDDEYIVVVNYIDVLEDLLEEE